MPIFLRRAGLACVAFLLMFAMLQSASALAGPEIASNSQVFLPMVWNSSGGPQPKTMAQQVIDLTNRERANFGCAPLVLSSDLSAAAQRHSRDMAINNIFSHTGSDGSNMQTRIADTGYNYARLAENIAVGQSTAADVVHAWMNSNMGHRENILNCELREIGVGFYDQPDDQANVRDDTGNVSGPYRFYWTQDFGTPR